MATIGVGMLGYAFMGKAHSNAYRKIAYLTWPPPLEPKLVGIAGRNQEAVQEAADRYGFEYGTDDWRGSSPTSPSACSTTAARMGCTPSQPLPPRRAGKHVICEKPLGRDAAESYDIWQAVAATGVKHLCGFNYRFVPAMRLRARSLTPASWARSATSAPATCRTGATTRRSTRGGSIETWPGPARLAT